MKNNIRIPLDVPEDMKKTYQQNYELATKGSGRLMLFAGDQKVEHLNNDFFGDGIAAEDNDPVHLFNIASKARIGAFATQLGLIAQYGNDFPRIPYIIKLNSKTNLVKTSQVDPMSNRWFGIDEVLAFKKISKLNIVGVGYTVYIGSEHESQMLVEAARTVFHAHMNGLLSVIWAYPRGKAVSDEKNPHLIAGAAGVAACMGADFVKVNYPKQEGILSAEALQEAVQAAGRTKLICAGGSSMDVQKFLEVLYDQLHIAGTSGNATGRNIHQKPLDEAVRFCNAIYAMTVEDKSVQEAMNIYNSRS